MPSQTISPTPGLASFLRSLKTHPVEASIEHLISLLKRRQIRHSRPCAIATAHLLLRVISAYRWSQIEQLIDRVRAVGQRLCTAQPRELVVGNIVRRVLGLIREEAEEDREVDGAISSDADAESQNTSTEHADESMRTRPILPSSISAFSPLKYGATIPSTEITSGSGTMSDDGAADLQAQASDSRRPPLLTSHTSYATTTPGPMVQSMFNLLSHPATPSPTATPPGAQSPANKAALTSQRLASLSAGTDLKPEIIGGIEEIIDELGQVDEQIAGYALEHIHTNEIIMTHTSSLTVQKFLLRAAAKRKFTVVHAEAHPNDHEGTHATVVGASNKYEDDDISPDNFRKSLVAAGITVILIPDSAVFALMSRVNKVILGTHAVLANGGLVAAAGAKTIALAAKAHRTPVVIVSGVFKLSPVYPFDFEALIEHGSSSRIFDYEDGDLVDKVDVENPIFDYVPADLVDLYITNLGGHAPSYLYRIVSDHYRVEDINL